jgi:hypothetical protein
LLEASVGAKRFQYIALPDTPQSAD